MKEYNIAAFDKAQKAIYNKMIAHYNAYKECEEQLDDSLAKWNDLPLLQAKVNELTTIMEKEEEFEELNLAGSDGVDDEEDR